MLIISLPILLVVGQFEFPHRRDDTGERPRRCYPAARPPSSRSNSRLETP
jgi:hypothetical protein